MSVWNKSFFNVRSRLLAATSVLALGCSAMICGPAYASSSLITGPIVTNWTGASTTDPTDLSDPTNWDNGVPTTVLPAYFGTGTNVNIAVNVSQQLGKITIDGGTAVGLLPGSVLNDDMIVGDTGVGSFANTNATHNVTGNLILGNQSSGNGTYTITGESAATNINFAGTPGSVAPQLPNGALIVGNYGTGVFTQGTDATDAGNQVNVAGDLAVGLNFGGTGAYTLNSGSLTVGGAMVVGEASTNNNVFTQNGGSVNLTGTAGSDSRYASTVPGAIPQLYAGNLYVGAGSTTDNGVGTYNLNGGTLLASTIEIGFGGTGTINQTGGAVTASYIDMGDCGGCNGGNAAGFYNLSGTGSLVTGGLSLGDFGHGEFLQSGASTNTINGTLSIGNGATAQPNFANPGNYDRSGTYTLVAGNLNTSYTVVGSQGTGTFNQSGGAHTVTDTLTVGQTYQSPSGPLGTGTTNNIVFGGPALGFYNMSGGTLIAGGDPTFGVDTNNAGIIVGDAGTGTFNQTGGAVTSGVLGGQEGDLIIGNHGGVDAVAPTLAQPAGTQAQAGGQGTYNLGQTGQSQTPSLQVYGNAILGNGTSASGANPANGSLAIAGNGTAMSVYATSNYVPQNGGNILIGVNGTGSVTQTDQSSVYLDHYLVLGVNAGSNGSYTLSATSTSANSGYNLFVGSDLNVGGYNPATDIYGYTPQTTSTGGTGTFTQTSGDVFVVGSANIGNSGGTGTYAMSGGTLTVGNNLNVGNGAGVGTFNQTGGVVTTGTTGTQEGDLIIGAEAGSTGTYSLTDPTNSETVQLVVNGNTDIGRDGSNGTLAAANGSLTIGSGTDSPTFATTAAGAANGDVTVGDGGIGTLTVNSGFANINGILGAGVNGTGTIIQTGGVVIASYLDLSTPVGSGSSSYTLSGGTLTTLNDLNVGGGSTGTVAFTQSGAGSQTNVGGTLRVGNASGMASYSLSNGQLSVGGDSYVGIGPYSGTMTQSGGSHLVGGTLFVGDGTSTGLYTLTGGTLSTGLIAGGSTGDVVVGNGGTGEIDNSGGQQISNSIDGVTIGWSGNGTYKLTGTGSLNVAANENIGVFGAGTFIQGDGNGTTSNTIGGSLYLSSGYGGPASSYTLTDGTLQTAGSEIVGFAAASTFTQSGGTNTVGGELELGLLANSPTQFGNGTYNLSGKGSLSVAGDTTLGVNTGTVGTFNQSGGTFVTQSLTVGGSGTGTFYQTAGNTDVLGQMMIGNGGTATVTSLQANSITNNNKLVLADANVTAPITNNGLLEGTGTITGNVTNSGTLHPGASPGILNIIGDYIQLSTGLMDFTVAGTTPGTGYSQLNATGSLNLAGALDITDTSFKLTTGDDFELLTAGKSINGSLSNVLFDSSVCTLSSGLYACSGNGQTVDFQEIVSSNAIDFVVEKVSASAVPLPAALPMFGASMVGLIGVARARRRKAAATK